MNAILDVVGPDDEIERAGIEFEAHKILRPYSTMKFEQYLEMKTPKKSFAWAYISNRQGNRTLISF